MGSVLKKEIDRYRHTSYECVEDDIVVEEPLEVFLNYDNTPLLVTMRTPGKDEELVLGLLFTMGIFDYQSRFSFIPSASPNSIRIYQEEFSSINTSTVFQNSSCGLCNRASWEDINQHSLFPVFNKAFKVSTDVILQCSSLISTSFGQFQSTGGCHRITIIDHKAQIVCEAEDVGRHNAFDKVLGQCIKKKALPLENQVAILSGRCSYEMCQKAWLAGIPIVVSLGAPTSKAIEHAEQAGVTLVGFAKADSFNIYAHPQRISK